MDMSEYTKQKKILVVDDSEFNCSILLDVLSDAFDVVIANNGLEAIEKIENNPKEFSIILLDIIMPVMNGIECLTVLNQKHWISDIPVLVISSDANPESMKTCYDLGALDFIEKPFDYYVIYKKITNAIEECERKKIRSHITQYERQKNMFFWDSVRDVCFEYMTNSEGGLVFSRYGENFLKNNIYGVSEYDSSSLTTDRLIKSTLNDILSKISPENPTFNFACSHNGENYVLFGESNWEPGKTDRPFAIYGILRRA